MSSGYPDNNPKTKFGVAKAPLHLVPPALIRGAAEAWKDGAAKYGPFNWREHKISSSVYYAAALRHLTDWYDRIDQDDVAPDSKVHHLKHAVACLGMLLDTIGSDKLNDDRPARCPSAAPVVGQLVMTTDMFASAPSESLQPKWLVTVWKEMADRGGCGNCGQLWSAHRAAAIGSKNCPSPFTC